MRPCEFEARRAMHAPHSHSRSVDQRFVACKTARSYIQPTTVAKRFYLSVSQLASNACRYAVRPQPGTTPRLLAA